MLKRSGLPLLVLSIVLWGCVSCGFFVAQQVTSLQVNPPTASVQTGNSLSLTATAVNNDGSRGTATNVNWTSSNPQIATVSTAGMVTGVSPGTATITATSGTLSGAATVTVGSTSSSVTIAPANSTVSLATGAVQFTATVNGEDVTASTTWTSSNTSVGQFSAAGVGLLTLTGQGTTTITATGTVNGSTVSGTTNLTVTP